MQSRQIATVAFFGLTTLSGIEEAGYFRAMQNLQFGHFRSMKVPRLGNPCLLLLRRRPFLNPAIRVPLTHPLHGQFDSALGFVVGAHHASVIPPAVFNSAHLQI